MTVRRLRLNRFDVALAFAGVAVVVSVALATLSPSGGLPERARAIEAQLRCPTCQGLSIADSPATSAVQMRALVAEQLASGASDDAVRSFFVARYGRWILLDPPAAGLDLILWIAPAMVVASGSLLVVRRARAGGPERSRRTWTGAPTLPGRRLATIAVSGGMVLALAVPIAAAVVPRLAGLEATGRSAAQRAPSISELQAFVAAEPTDVEALVALGTALLEANRPGEAADRYKAALALDPNNVTALLGAGSIFLGADRPDAAGAAFDRVLSLVPDQPDALLYRATARLRLDGAVSDRVGRDLRRFLAVTTSNDPRRAMATALLAGSTTLDPGASGPAPTLGPSP